jgi:hypothetical protein
MPGPSCRAPVADASWQSQLGCSCGSARATTSGLLLQCNDGAGRCSCSPKVVHEGLCSLPWPPREACLPCRVYRGRLGGCSTRAEQPLLVHAQNKPARTNREASSLCTRVLQPPCPQAVGRWRAVVVVAPRRASLQTPSCSSLDSWQASLRGTPATAPRRQDVRRWACCSAAAVVWARCMSYRPEPLHAQQAMAEGVEPGTIQSTYTSLRGRVYGDCVSLRPMRLGYRGRSARWSVCSCKRPETSHAWPSTGLGCVRRL